MRPIYLLGADEIEEAELAEVDNPVKAHKLALEIEANLPAIHRFWVPRRKAAVRPSSATSRRSAATTTAPAAAARSSRSAAAPRVREHYREFGAWLARQSSERIERKRAEADLLSAASASPSPCMATAPAPNA
jgi:pyruvate/2-oxoglutarate dehydrogenase complex dihydrolipoamide acyltransferase (E2) component